MQESKSVSYYEMPQPVMFILMSASVKLVLSLSLCKYALHTRINCDVIDCCLGDVGFLFRRICLSVSHFVITSGNRHYE